MPRSLIDFKSHVNQITRTKGETAGKRAGQTYCEEWRFEIDKAKKALMMQKNSIPAPEYNKKVVEFNKQTQELVSCITEHNKQFK